MAYGQYWSGTPRQGGKMWDSPAYADEQQVRDKRNAAKLAAQQRADEESMLRELFSRLSGLRPSRGGGAPMEMGGGIDPRGPMSSEFNALGGRGRAPKGMPEGHYTLARYPGLEYELWRQERGFAPKGMQMAGLTPKQQEPYRRQAQEFVDAQRSLLNIPSAPRNRAQEYADRYNARRRR